ncbi:MAG: hypothetical protein AMJ56_14290 [Anaerolineae bacterium SG8_19]|nr:MAG: hypothetical protein AMJ56_14290 [Anaerolineae bacterium SG8_19]
MSYLVNKQLLKTRLSLTALLIFLSILLLLIASFSLARFGYHYSEADAFVFTRRIIGILDENTLTPSVAYVNGYGYPALAVFLIKVTGLSLVAFQRYGGALLAVVMVLPAFILYRELTLSRRAALLATLILVLQPELLFPILRGTHEKFTRTLMILSLFLFVRSLRRRSKASLFGGIVIAFYLVAYAQITFNSFFADSYLIAVALAMFLVGVALRLNLESPNVSDKNLLHRLNYILISLLVLTFLFIFYLYAPARDQIFQLRFIADRLAALFLDVEASDHVNPYLTVTNTWESLPTYVGVSAATWLLLITSGLIWLHQTSRHLRQRRAFRARSQMLLWAFYGAFAAIGAISIIVDISGALASNLQVRAFPAFAILAAPVLAIWLLDQASGRGRSARLVRTGLWVALGLMTLFSTWKAANEPLVSNKWTFYEPAEVQAIDWADNNLVENRSLWISIDERLVVRLDEAARLDDRRIELDTHNPEPLTRDSLISETIRTRAARLNLPLPIGGDSLMTYDNGQAQIYHFRPRTPYQP